MQGHPYELPKQATCLFLRRPFKIQLENRRIFLLQAVQPCLHLYHETPKSTQLKWPEMTRLSQPILYREVNCFLKHERERLKLPTMRCKHTITAKAERSREMLRGNMNFSSAYTVQKGRGRHTKSVREHTYHHVRVLAHISQRMSLRKQVLRF